MMTEATRGYVLIGSGVAAIAALQAIRSLDNRAVITIISEDPYGYYSRPGLAYYLTHEITRSSLFPFTPHELQAFNARWVRQRAIAVEPIERLVYLADGSRVPYYHLLLATGSLAVALDVPGANLAGVSKLDDMRDAQAMLTVGRKASDAVVVGGGITALEIVEGLRAQGTRVHYLMRGQRYWSNVLDEAEEEIVIARLRRTGVQIHPNCHITEISGRRRRVNGVRLQDGRRIACQMVAYAIGVQPRLELAHSAGLKIERGVLADEFLQSSQKHIWVAGDIAQVYDPFSDRQVLDTLWSTARHQGHVAGMNMAGAVLAYRKQAPLNVTRLAGITMTIIGTVGHGTDPSLVGIARGDSESWRLLPDALVAECQTEVNRLRLMIGERHILGAVLMGDQTLSLALQDLVGQRVDISSERPRLLSGPDLAETVLMVWKRWRISHAF